MSLTHKTTGDRAEDGIEIALHILQFMMCVLPGLLLTFLYWPLTYYLAKVWRLDRLAVRYQNAKEWLVPVRYLAFAACVVSIYYACMVVPNKTPWFSRYAWALATVCVALFSGLTYSLVAWIEKLHVEPEIQRLAAGLEAEVYVKGVIERLQISNPHWHSMHGVLLVFQVGTSEEFSIEIDHLLVTQHNCYLVETKYRNATVSAVGKAMEWKTVASDGRQGQMRNALSQAKQNVRVLEQQYALPCRIIPVVAIHGADTTIVDGPANVVRSDKLLDLLYAFEEVNTNYLLRPDEIVAQVIVYRATDDVAMRRHIERANQAKRRWEAKAIVSRSSLT